MTAPSPELPKGLSQLQSLKQLNTGASSLDKYTSTKHAVNAILKEACISKDAVELMTNAYRTSNNNPAMPTYNVRTPVVSIYINDMMIFPVDALTDSGGNGSDQRTHFKDLSMSYPLGGVDCTVRGTVKLFAKDPSSIIQALSNTVYNPDSLDGLPSLKMQWGWNFATTKGVNGIKQALTPLMQYIITNVTITNPDVGGTDFTFDLQDVGNCIANYTAVPFNLESGYPQDQMRSLIEGCMGLRLFTLDDLLNLKNQQDPTTSTQLVGQSSDPASNANLTFFTNDPLGTTRTHNDNYKVLAERLATHCKCRWYAAPNSAISDTATEGGETYNTLMKAQAQLEDMKNRNTYNTKQKKPVAYSDKQLKTQQDAIDVAFAEMSFGCKLYWCEAIPADWKTSSGTENIKSFTHAGAYLLLPDLADTTVSALGYMDLNYGPGASNFPYLHGSAQNVFNASIAGLPKTASQTFGEVLGINVQYSPLMTMLQSSIQESAMYAIDGKYLTSSDKGNIPVTVVRKDPNISQAQQDINEAAGKAVAAAADKTKAATASAQYGQQSGAVHSIFKGGYSNNFTLVDAPTLAAADKQYYNIKDGKTYASMQLRSRINQFLKWPIRATFKVLGDPTLIRLNQGGFEVLSYFPSGDGLVQNLNTLISGTYTALQLTHTLSADSYTTELIGLKEFDKSNMSSLVTQIIEGTTSGAPAAIDQSAAINMSTTIDQSLSSAAVQVDLSSDSFTKGFLSTSLQKLYKQQSSLN